MNNDHYALIIGLRKYPGLGDPPAHLKGPENDAAAMEQWLTDPGGGALPPENVKVLSSRGARKNRPDRGEIEAKMFMWVEALAEKNEKNRLGRRVGQRLYFHVSGHGFSAERGQGCLIAANALSNSTSSNISASAWLQWWQEADYFSEFVLSMDCCMDRMSFVNPAEPPLAGVSANKEKGPSFVAFAAQRNQRAVERPIPHDNSPVQGVFTWVMLQGLRGAAADDLGRVTGHSLAKWLRNAIQPWLYERDLANASISKLPEIVTEDDTLLLAQIATPFLFDITLQFDAACAGLTGRLWSGVPSTPQPLLIGADGKVELKLTAGLHAAEVTAGLTTWRQAFAVTRAAVVPVTATGAPITQSAGLQTLAVPTSDPSLQIQVTGAHFRPMATGYGKLKALLPFGLYRVTRLVGRKFMEDFVILDAPWPQAAILAPMPEITSAAPLPGTAATRNYHQDALFPKWLRPKAKQPVLQVGTGAELLVMARCFTAEHAESPIRRPWDGVKVLDSNGAVIADLAEHGYRDDKAADPWAVCRMTVAPGNYTLRYGASPGMSNLERSLHVPPAADGGAPWRLEAYLLHRSAAGAPAAAADSASSLFMRRVGTLDWETDLLLEKARVALADDRPILNDDLAPLLFEGVAASLASMIGGHLVLLAEEKGFASPVSLDEVVVQLRHLVGSDHPDVEALSLRCIDPALRRTTPFGAPPLLERSWRLMVAASQDVPDLVPLPLWRRVQARVASMPYLVWSADTVVQTSQNEALRETLLRETRDGMPPASPAQEKPTPMAAFQAAGLSGRPEQRSGSRHSSKAGPSEVSAAMHAHGKTLGLPPAAVAALLGGALEHGRRH